MRERLSDGMVAEIATNPMGAEPTWGEAQLLAREVRDRREAERRDAGRTNYCRDCAANADWVALGRAVARVDELDRNPPADQAVFDKLLTTHPDYDAAQEAVYAALASVRGAAKEEGGEA